MTFRELFANCWFTLSRNVPGQDKQLIKKITNLGFSVRNVDPLVIQKSSSSSVDINSLIEVIQQAFEPQIGDDFVVIEADKSFKVNEECTESSATTVEDFPNGESTGSHSSHDSSAKDVDLLTRQFNTLCIESSEIDAPRQDQTVRKNLQSGNSTRPLDLSSSSFIEEQPDVHMHIPTVSKGSSQQNLNEESDSSTKSLCASGLIEGKETTFVGDKITTDENETVSENISENDDKCSNKYKIKSKSDQKLTETSTLKSEGDNGKQNKDDKIKCKPERQPFNAEKTFPTKNEKQSKITMENSVVFGSDKTGSTGKQVSDVEKKGNRDEGDKTGSTGKQVSDVENKGNRDEGDKTGSFGKQLSDVENKGNRDEGDKTGSTGKQLSDVENKGNRDGAEINSKAGIQKERLKQKKSGDIGNELGMNRNCADFGEIKSNVDGEEEKFYDCNDSPPLADLQSESDNLSNDGKLAPSQTSEMAVACSDVSSKTQSEMGCNERRGSDLRETSSRSGQKEEAQRISGKDSKIDFKKAETAVSVEVLKLRDPVKGHSLNDKNKMQQSEENYPGSRVSKLYPDLINLPHNEADPTADCKSSMETGLFNKPDTAKGWPQGAYSATGHTDLSVVSTGEKRIVGKKKYPGYADKESRPSGAHNETDVALVNLTRGSIGDTTNGEISFSYLTDFTREYTKAYNRDNRKTGDYEDTDMKRRSSRTCTETDVHKFSTHLHNSQMSTGKNVSTNREACISQQANLVRDSPEAYSRSDRKTKKSHHVVLPKESVGEYAKPFSSSKAGTKIGRDTGPVHDQTRAKPPTRDNNDGNNKYTNEFRSSQPMDSSSESEEESNESDSDSQTLRNRIGVEEHLGKVGDEAGHKLQTGRKKDRFEENIRQRIKFDPQTDLTLLGFILLLPRKTKCPDVKVLLDETEEGIIIVEGRPNEVINIQEMIEETLRRSETSSMQHKLQGQNNNVKLKEQGAYVAESTTEVAPHSIYKKQNVGPPVYKTTYSDSFKDPLRPERREYGSSVDHAQPQSKGFFTERKKIRIQVMKSDITTQQVDAIVNAANGSLKHGGGVARAIADKAGSELQMECARFIKDGNAIPVTGLFVSCGGKLPAKHVIHAVGPRWSRYGEEKKEECARDLRRTVLHCLLEADQRGLRSIAIPSISAAIFAVPVPICTMAYLQAVQTFDILADFLGRDTLQEIRFVDVTEDMVKNIHKCFYRYWKENVPMQQANEDFDFAEEHCHAMKWNKSKENRSSQKVLERGNHSKTEASSYTRDYSSHKPSESAARGRQRDESIRPSQPSFAADRYRDYTYSIGRTVLRISCEPALVQAPDLIVVVGDLFRELPYAPDFDPENIPRNPGFAKKKNSFVFLGGTNSQPLILKLFIEDYKQGSINKVFRDLKETLTSAGIHLTLMQSFVFTSSVLYSSDDRAGAYPKLDPKLVGAFTRNVYEFLKTCTTSEGTLSVTISTGQAAFPIVQKVLDSRQEEAKKSGKGGDSSMKHKRSTEECGVCLDEIYEPHMLTCCSGAICKSCFEKVKSQRCPFCRKPFTSMRGNQPKGRMDVCFDRTVKLKGHEKFGSYKITYIFERGQQEKDHPEPGKPYDWTKRDAYLPASEEGIRVLRLLRVAFLRRLTFTIGDSYTTGKKGVITWNDIHHKTSLKEGSAHGYPDPDYLSNVTRELADRGVTEASMSEDEKKDASRIYERIKRFDRFLDF